jgi:hypothetical protein
MSEERRERELRELFQQQRREDERIALPFARFLGPASPRAAGSPRLARVRFAAAAAVAVVVVLSLGTLRLRTPHSVIDTESWSALSQWTAATDSFLEWPGSPLDTTTVSTPSDVWIDSMKVTDQENSNHKETL